MSWEKTLFGTKTVKYCICQNKILKNY